MSSDGNTALITTQNKSAAYVFVRSGTAWMQQAELTALDGAPGDAFGISAALSSDGNTLLIGASEKTVGGNATQGAAYVFVRSGTTWTQQTELTASDGVANEIFGFSAALSSDGNTALIGAYHKEVAYVFVRSGTTWTQQTEMTAITGATGFIGTAAALSSDGNTALVGAREKTVSGNTYQGAAYVFVRNGTTWMQQAELTAFDGAALDYFGFSAALSSDGNTPWSGRSRRQLVATQTRVRRTSLSVTVRRGCWRHSRRQMVEQHTIILAGLPR